MKKLIVCAAVGIFSLALSAAETITYRQWLLDNGVTPTIGGAGNLDGYPPERAFDGSWEGTMQSRYLSVGYRKASKVTLVYGADDFGKRFEVSSYRICRQTYVGNNHATRLPLSWTVEGSDTPSVESSWTVVDDRTVTAASWGTVGTTDPWQEFALETPVSYRYYRLTFKRTSGSDTDAWVCVMEVEYRGKEAEIEVVTTGTYLDYLTENGVTPTIGGENFYTGGGGVNNPTNAFDGIWNTNDETKRYLGKRTGGLNGNYSNWGRGASLVFGGNVPGKLFQVTHYRICRLTCGGLADTRVPTAWYLEGADSADGPWTIIDTRSGVTNWGEADNPWLEFVLPKRAYYNFYRLTLTASSSNDSTADVGVMEVQYCGDDTVLEEQIYARPTYGDWLLSRGVEPTIGGTNWYASGNIVCCPTNAFDGWFERYLGTQAPDAMRTKRYLGKLEGHCQPTISLGGVVANRAFTMTSYRICQQTLAQDYWAERRPKSWALEGAESPEGPWTLIEARTLSADGREWGGLCSPWLEFFLKSPVSYPFYQLRFITAVEDSGIVCAMEVEFCSSVLDGVRVEAPTGKLLRFDTSYSGDIAQLSGAGDVVFDHSDNVTIRAAEGFSGKIRVLSGSIVLPKSLTGRVTLENGATAVYKSFSEMAALSITFDVTGYAGTSTLENFPVLVRLSETAVPGFSYALANGTVRAAAVDADTEYPCDVESWNPNGESLVWVRLPALAKTGTAFRLLFGGGASSFAASETWRRTDKTPDDGTTDTENFAAVWHMATASREDVPDATGNGLTAVPYTNTTTKGYADSLAVSGPVGTARQVSALKNRNGPKLAVPARAYNERQLGASFTASCWARLKDLPNDTSSYYSWPRFFSCKATNGNTVGWEIEAGGDGSSTSPVRQFSIAGAGGEKLKHVVSEDIWSQHEDGWDYFTFVYDGKTVSAYTNGALMVSGTFNKPVDNRCSDQDFFIGGAKDEWSFAGEMDEARLFDGVQSADWIAADYATQTRADFLTVKSSLDVRVERVFGTTIEVLATVICPADETRHVTVTVKDGAEVVKTLSRDVRGPSVVERFYIDDLKPSTAYSIEATSEGAGVETRMASFEVTTVKCYKMKEGDLQIDSHSSFGDTPSLTTHQNNWVNVDDPNDVLAYPAKDSDFEFLLDATELGPTGFLPKCWMLRTYGALYRASTSPITFPGRRLTIIGKRNADDLTYQAGEGGGLGIRNYYSSITATGLVTIRDLCLKNGSVWNEASDGVTANLQARIEIPSGYFGFFECAQNNAASRYLGLYGSFVGEGTAVFCLYDNATADVARGFYLHNDLSAFAGKFVFDKARNVYFCADCVPPGDLAELTTDGITLNNRFHKMTEPGRSCVNGVSRLIFEDDTTWATPNRGITVDSGDYAENHWNFMIRNGKTVTLKNPLYGSGMELGLNGENADYQTGTLKLCGAQGDWSGTFSMTNGTLVLAGAKPLGDGTLSVSGTGEVKLDASALTDGACYLKAFDGAKIDVTGVEASADMEDVALLKTPATGGVTRDQLNLDLPEGVALRTSVAEGIRTFTVGKKVGIVIVVR